jgi:hypothetical protein
VNALVLAIFTLVMLTDLVVRQRWLDSSITLLPDALSGVVLVAVAARYLATRKLYLGAGYLLLLITLLLVIALGILWQTPSSGAIVSGLRQYFKFLPLLLLPAVYEFTPRQLKTQLVLIVGLLMLQPLLAVYQRFIQYSGDMHSGDMITGTLSSSGSLSLLMICALAFFVCAYLRGYIGMTLMLGATVFCSVPTMLNETKIAIVLIPLAVVLPVLCMPERRRLWKKLTPIVGAAAVTLVLFVAVYDFLAQYNPYTTPIAKFLTERSLTSYLYTGRSSVAEDGFVGRADSIVLAVERLSRQPMALAFGLGIGNVSESPIRSFSGEFTRYQMLYGAGMTQISHLLWEVGIAGTAIYLLLFFVVWRDALWLTRRKDFYGLLGHAWTTTIALLTLGLFYLPLFVIDEIAAPLWFFAGVVAAARARAFATNEKRDAVQTSPHVSLSSVN